MIFLVFIRSNVHTFSVVDVENGHFQSIILKVACCAEKRGRREGGLPKDRDFVMGKTLVNIGNFV